MKTRNRSITNLLIVLTILSATLLALFPGTSWSVVPTYVTTPADKSKNNPVNTAIIIQFSESMDPSFSVEFDFVDEWERKVPGTYQWSTTTHTNDTLKFTPTQALSHGMHYEVDGGALSGGDVWTGFLFYFITEPSPADATPPTVQLTYPYDGMIDVPTGLTVICILSEAIDPSTVNSTNITLSGPGISGPSDYKVLYDYFDGHLEIRKNTQLSAFQTYTVRVSTNVMDLKGNHLQSPYQWSFITGAADLTAPTVLETIPVNGATNFSNFHPTLHAIFSEELDEDTVNTSNITLHDNTAGSDVNIVIEPRRDLVRISPRADIQLQNGHSHTLTIGTGVKDLAGNGLSTPYYLSFTVAGVGVDTEPVISGGTKDNQNIGVRLSDGSSRVQLDVGAIDDFTSPLTVYATTPPSYKWNLTTANNWDYYYDSSSGEGLSPGPHTLTFTIKDSTHTVSFQRDIFIFDASPTLASPANGASAVSTTPTFQWSYSGSSQPLYYMMNVFDAPGTDSTHLVWRGFCAGPGASSVSVPYDKQLAPNTTYYWFVIGFNKPSGNGITASEMRSFTTGNGATPGVLSVARAEDFTSSGTQGGPFSPSSKVYTLQNTGSTSINWSASKTQTWVDLSATSGTLTAGATTTVTVSINSGANSLAPGTFNDTVTFTNTTNGSGNTTRGVGLTVNATQGVLSVTPPEGFTSSGTQGGPFSPSNKVYTLQNMGGTSINWSASKTQTWVDLSTTSGTLTAGATTTVTVSINSGANSLAPGTFNDTVTFTNSSNGSGNTTRNVSLIVNATPGAFSVTPQEELTSSGMEGGPFSPSSKEYTLQNTGGTSINWSASKTQTWVKLSKANGSLAPGDSVTVNVSILPATAKMFQAGALDDTVTFTNKTNGVGTTTRKVNLSVDAINISLLSPPDSENYAVCTYYPAFGPPTFAWDINGGTLKSLELQFYAENNPSKIVKVEASATDLAQKSLQVKAAIWKNILLLPGTGGGEVDWKIVGTKQNSKKVESNMRSFFVAAPEAIGNPQIDPTGKATVPILSWLNNCNSKFKVWFYNDPEYYDNPTKAGVKKTSLSFTDTDPTDNSGVFTKQLTSGQWTAIQNVVAKASGSTIYWHVETSDVVSPKRIARTGRQQFTLKD